MSTRTNVGCRAGNRFGLVNASYRLVANGGIMRRHPRLTGGGPDAGAHAGSGRGAVCEAMHEQMSRMMNGTGMMGGSGMIGGYLNGSGSEMMSGGSYASHHSSGSTGR